jgi:hypothetical protein
MALEEKENIDNFFRDRLYNYEAPAPMDVWKRIDGQMEQKRAKTRWIMIGSMAASIAILISLSIGYYIGINHHQSEINNEAVTAPNILNSPIKRISNVDAINNSADNKLNKNVLKNNSSIINKGNSINKNKVYNYNNTSVLAIQNTTTENTPAQNMHSPVVLAVFKPINSKLLNTKNLNQISVPNSYINEYLASEKSYFEFYEPETEEKHNYSWSVGGSAAPLYSYRNIQSNNSDYSTEALNKAEKPILSYAGGIKVNFEINRWSFESGVLFSQIGQNISNPSTTRGVTTISNTGGDEYIQVNYLGSNGVYEIPGEKNRPGSDNSISTSSNFYTVSEDYDIVNSNGITNSGKRNENNTKITSSPGNSGDKLIVGNQSGSDKSSTVEYRYKYIEVPFITHYRILGSAKVNLSLSGGISANFLVGNNVYDNNNNTLVNEGIEKINYAGILGFSLNFPIAQQLDFLLEPRYRYNLNSISKVTNIDTHYYSFGVFTGVSYRF